MPPAKDLENSASTLRETKFRNTLRRSEIAACEGTQCAPTYPACNATSGRLSFDGLIDPSDDSGRPLRAGATVPAPFPTDAMPASRPASMA
jgi:hypothetical protein